MGLIGLSDMFGIRLGKAGLVGNPEFPDATPTALIVANLVPRVRPILGLNPGL